MATLYSKWTTSDDDDLDWMLARADDKYEAPTKAEVHDALKAQAITGDYPEVIVKDLVVRMDAEDETFDLEWV